MFESLRLVSAMASTKNFSPRFGLRTFLAAVLLSLLACFLPMDFGERDYLMERIADAFHYLLLGGLSAGAFLAFRPLCTSAVRAAIQAFVCCSLLAVFIEIVQPWFGRSESIVDFQNGVLGSVTALLGFFLLPQENRQKKIGWILIWSGGLCLTLVPAWHEWQAERLQRRLLPVLADFEQDWQLRFWSPLTDDDQQEEQLTAVEGPGKGRYLRVETNGKDFSGVEYRTNGLDLTSAENLRFAVYALDFSRINLRIDDYNDCSDFDSRYNGSFALQPGWNEIAVPVDSIRHAPAHRTLDISAIKRLLFFVAESGRPGEFRLDDICLSSSS
jgi:VanZ family protein